MWLLALERAGYRARLADGGRRLSLIRGDHESVWQLRRYRRTPRPSEMVTGTDDLVWVPAMTAGLRDRLSSLDISWITDTGELHIHSPSGLIVDEQPRVSVEIDDRTDLPRLSLGALATLQYLLERPTPTTQNRVATAVGLSQPRIAQVLKVLSSAGLVSRNRSGWHVIEAGRAFDTWLAAARWPFGATAGWYSLAPPSEQLVTIARRAGECGAQIRLCGDWAADVLAPWRPPSVLVVHSDMSLDLNDVGFVTAQPEAATVLVHIGPVRDTWSPAAEVIAAMAASPADMPLAPVTEVAREIAVQGGSDADQAVAELRRVWLRARSVAAEQDVS
jgi:hypothetical protein